MKRSESPQKLFNVPVLLLITAVLIGFLVLLFPWKSANFLSSQDSGALKEQFSSRLLAQYHQLLNDPQSTNEQVLKLAQEMSEKGLWESSRRLLSEKLSTADLSTRQRKQLATIQLRNYLDAYYTASTSGEDFSDQHIDVRQHLQYLEDYNSLNRKELQALAKASTDFGLLPQAVKIYHRLADVDTAKKASWLAEAGRWSEHAGDPVSAAKDFKTASELSKNTGRFNAYTYAWLSAASKAGQKEEVKDFLNEAQFQLPESPKALEALAKASLDAGLPESASNLYAHLAKRDSVTNKQRWLEKAAHWATETKMYSNASHYLEEASELATKDSDRWTIQQRLIEVYIKDNRHNLALNIIEPLIKHNPGNMTLLKKGVGIALLEKDLDLARDWNGDRLELQPDSYEAIISQADIETIDENFEEAAAFVKRAVKQKPKDLKLRERWAYLEEMKGNDTLALQLWQWIYEQSGDTKHQEQVIRIAQSDLDGDGLAFLITLSESQELPHQTVNDIFFHLVRKAKHNAKAEEFLTDYLAMHGPDREFLEILAKWYGAEERYEEALATWSRLEQSFGSSNQYALTRFELHWALKQKDKAYQLWRENHQQWREDATDNQLAIMGEVAWTYQHNAVALAYYQRLLKSTDQSEVKQRILFHTRIALLHDKLGQSAAALAAIKRGFMETADTDLMITGMQIAFDAKDYQGFATLLALSKEQSSRFASEPRYWLMQAAIANSQKNYQQALSLFQKVLALNPNSKDAQSGIDSIQKIALDARKQATLKQLVAMQEAFDKKQYGLLEKLFAASDAKLSEFADMAQYWLLRAQFNYQKKHYAQAINSYKRLLHLKPDSVPARQGMILAFTQLKDFATLRQLLKSWETFAESHDELWPNYATAYQAMKDYQSSIKWFEMASVKHTENFIMLLSYAESLEQLDRKSEAAKVRAFGVQQLKQQLASGSLNPAERKEALFQYLSVTHKSGTQAEFDKIYAELDRLTTDKADKDRMNEIAISWALDKNNMTQLKRLLARTDVKRMKKPLWMALSIALKLKDKRTLAALLKQSDQMSTSDHVSVLIALERQQEAFDVAKRAMNEADTAKERDTARRIALSLAEGRVSEFVAAYNARKVGTLTTREQTLQYKQGMGKYGLPAGFDIKLRKAQLSDNSLPGTKVNEQDVSVGFEWKDTTNQLNGRLGIYDNGTDLQAYGNLKYQRQLNERLRAGLEYGFQETPDENSYLRQYGRRNRLKVDFNAQLGEKQTAQLSAWKHEFNRTDNGQNLADGLGARAAVVHRQNTVNGQWYGGIQGTLQKNDNASQVSTANALPESTQSVELIAGFNHGIPGQGLSGKSELQYSGSVALGKVWPTGELKAHAEAAVSKDLFDNDELSLGVFYDKGSLGNPEDKGLLLQYRKFLDFPVTDK
ncbi:tetratricopeptide repeat protein [Leucothrix pacifica]|uniref:PelB C-terminal domain-containing protein n=1 Tax=Leucothrix pacifica TaxID=1247513 RepID=A0A317CNM3_9GAMM|nr:tetratricopeptide repeat protein [Leucothrix pacifica]PWQ99787.1 hypothetical protein DKW60_04750 [Leucothrix pacifica]